MEIELQEGESVLRQGHSYHRYAFQSVPGTLWLTDLRLYFHSTPVVPFFHGVSLPFDTMRTVVERNGIFGLDLGITVVMGAAWREYFLVPYRGDWMKAIRAELLRYR